jgi:hypothetical protein
MRTLVAAIPTLLLAACLADDPGPCEAAADHVAECTGARPPAIDQCDAEAADGVVAMGCDEIREATGGGKGDFFGSVWCGLGGSCEWSATISLVDATLAVPAPVLMPIELINTYTAVAKLGTVAPDGTSLKFSGLRGSRFLALVSTPEGERDCGFITGSSGDWATRTYFLSRTADGTLRCSE